MENIYLDVEDLHYTLRKHFKNKDRVSLEEILDELETSLDIIEDIEEKLKEIKKDE
jgi:hypothetical protein